MRVSRVGLSQVPVGPSRVRVFRVRVSSRNHGNAGLQEKRSPSGELYRVALLRRRSLRVSPLKPCQSNTSSTTEKTVAVAQPMKARADES